MFGYCIMTWKTFLDLFKENYECFVFDGKKWCIKCKTDIFENMSINLQLTDDFVKDDKIFFYNHLQSSITFLKKEDFDGVLQARV